MIRTKQRELTRQHVNTRHGASVEDGPECRLGFEKEGSIVQLPGAEAESADERRLETSTGESEIVARRELEMN